MEDNHKKSGDGWAYKALDLSPDHYEFKAKFNEQDVTLVAKKFYIDALDRAHRAEDQLEAIKNAWNTIQKFLGATQSQSSGLVRETSKSEVPG